jgi:hypothetical protein
MLRLYELITNKHHLRARSEVVITPPCHGGDRRFKSGRARQELMNIVPPCRCYFLYILTYLLVYRYIFMYVFVIVPIRFIFSEEKSWESSTVYWAVMARVGSSVIGAPITPLLSSSIRSSEKPCPGVRKICTTSRQARRIMTAVTTTATMAEVRRAATTTAVRRAAPTAAVPTAAAEVAVAATDTYDTLPRPAPHQVSVAASGVHFLTTSI